MSKTAKKSPRANQPKTVEQDGYNGWANYETWCVHLWLTNDQGTYETMREIVAEAKQGYEAGQTIRVYVEDLNPLLGHEASMFTDLLQGALDIVNWQEVAEAFSEDA
jgi:hypothetical protein